MALSLSAAPSPEGQACTHRREALEGSPFPTPGKQRCGGAGLRVLGPDPRRRQAGGRSRAGPVAGGTGRDA